MVPVSTWCGCRYCRREWRALIFRKGEVIRKVKEEELLPELFREIDLILEERKRGHESNESVRPYP